MFYPYAPSQKIPLKIAFVSNAEAKKAAKASRRAIETPKPPSVAGGTAGKNWLSFFFTFVTLHKKLHEVQFFSKRSFCKKTGLALK